MEVGEKLWKKYLMSASSSGIVFLPSLGINSNWPNRPRDPLNREKNLFPGLVWVLSTNLNDDSSSSWKYVYWLFVCEANWDWYLLTYFRSVYVAPVQSETCILCYFSYINGIFYLSQTVWLWKRLIWHVLEFFWKLTWSPASWIILDYRWNKFGHNRYELRSEWKIRWLRHRFRYGSSRSTVSYQMVWHIFVSKKLEIKSR